MASADGRGLGGSWQRKNPIDGVMESVGNDLSHEALEGKAEKMEQVSKEMETRRKRFRADRAELQSPIEDWTLLE